MPEPPTSPNPDPDPNSDPSPIPGPTAESGPHAADPSAPVRPEEGTTRPRLSVAIVCKNNEATIGRTIESVRGLADEVVALDSGSTDGTIGLLEAAGARVERVQWAGFAATKQMALEACRGEWILSLDSDESVEPDLAESIRRVIEQPGPEAPRACRVNRKVWYRGRFLEHAWQPEARLRLVRGEDVRSGRAHWGGLDPHDVLEVAEGRIADLAGTLRHDAIESFGSFLARQASHARVSAESLHAHGRRASRRKLVCSPVGAFAKQMVMKSAWRDGWRGWCAAGSMAAATLMKHVILLDLSEADRPDNRPPGR